VLKSGGSASASWERLCRSVEELCLCRGAHESCESVLMSHVRDSVGVSMSHVGDSLGVPMSHARDFVGVSMSQVSVGVPMSHVSVGVPISGDSCSHESWRTYN